MAEKAIKPGLKLALELGPILVFFLSFRWAPVPEGADDAARQLAQVIFATKVFVPVTILSLVASWFLTGSLPKMALITALVVLVFGGLTIWLQDATFIKMKPTIIYLAFAAILGFGLLRGQSYLKYLMGEVMPLKEEGWMKFTLRFTLFFLGLALANEIVWRSFDTATWVSFKTFFLPLASFGFIFSQMGLFKTYAADEERD
jgi:intracellular septation protein